MADVAARHRFAVPVWMTAALAIGAIFAI
jgi:hypothetical protein